MSRARVPRFGLSLFCMAQLTKVPSYIITKIHPLIQRKISVFKDEFITKLRFKIMDSSTRKFVYLKLYSHTKIHMINLKKKVEISMISQLNITKMSWKNHLLWYILDNCNKKVIICQKSCTKCHYMSLIYNLLDKSHDKSIWQTNDMSFYIIDISWMWNNICNDISVTWMNSYLSLTNHMTFLELKLEADLVLSWHFSDTDNFLFVTDLSYDIFYLKLKVADSRSLMIYHMIFF